MAARKNLSHPDKVRQRIQTSQLINRLQDHVVGKVKMSPQQVRSAEILLRKSLPDLSRVEMHHGGEVTVNRIERRIVDPKAPESG